jgi:hypothetical protein
MGSFEILGNLGDFIGGIAVVVTLIYLAIQVRQNTIALRTASRQEIVRAFRDHTQLILEHEAAAPLRDGHLNYPDMEIEDADLFALILVDLILFFQGTYALHESGTLEDATYEAYLTWTAANLGTPGGANWWVETKLLYPPRMVTAIDARIERGGLPDLREPDEVARDKRSAES